MKKTTKTASGNAPAPDVDSYLAALPSDQRETLETVRQAIRAAAPKAEELISYKVPAYRYHGWLVYFAAFPNHLGFYTVEKDTVKTFAKELAGFKISGTTIHFTSEHPLPAALIKKIVKVRMRENEARSKE